MNLTYLSILDAIADYICLVDCERLEIVYCNQSFKSKYNLAIKENESPSPKSLMKYFIASDEYSRVLSAIDSCKSSGQVHLGKLKTKTKDSVSIDDTLVWSITLVDDEHVLFKGVEFNSRNIPRRNQFFNFSNWHTLNFIKKSIKDARSFSSKKSIFQSSKLNPLKAQNPKKEDRFLRRVFHELKTPLHIITNELAELNDSAINGHDISEEIKHINDQIQSLVSTMNDINMITMSSSPSSKALTASLPSTTIDTIMNINIPTMIDTIIYDAQHNSPRSGQIINYSLNTTCQLPSYVQVNSKFQRIFYHLLQNAIRYSSNDAHITVSISHRPSSQSKITSIKNRILGVKSDKTHKFTFHITNTMNQPINTTLIDNILKQSQQQHQHNMNSSSSSSSSLLSFKGGYSDKYTLNDISANSMKETLLDLSNPSGLGIGLKVVTKILQEYNSKLEYSTTANTITFSFTIELSILENPPIFTPRCADTCTGWSNTSLCTNYPTSPIVSTAYDMDKLMDKHYPMDMALDTCRTCLVEDHYTCSSYYNGEMSKTYDSYDDNIDDDMEHIVHKHVTILSSKYTDITCQKESTNLSSSYSLKLPSCASYSEGYPSIHMNTNTNNTITTSADTTAADSVTSRSSILRHHSIDTEKLHVLVVDDSSLCQKLLTKILSKNGYIPDIACNGQEACEKLSHGSYKCDAVLMDLRMPIMDGISATRHCRESLRLHHLPIIAVTAESGTDIKQLAIDAGANLVVEKPSTTYTIVNTLKQVIEDAQDAYMI